MNIKIIGSGSYIPDLIVDNQSFEHNIFLDESGMLLNQPNNQILEKFSAITGIKERRYASAQYVTSDLAFFAAQKAIEDAGIDRETIDYILFSHNFGDVKVGMIQSDMVPCLAARAKHKLGIKNPKCVGFDIIFGCAGWTESFIQANAYIKSGMAKRILVIGAECLSRVTDKHDRDSMIYADGAGAVIVEGTNDDSGLISHESASYTEEEVKFLFLGCSFNADSDPNTRYIKMYGRKIYEFALNCVPIAMKSCLDKSGVPIEKLKKILIHQANEKMDEAIVHRFYKLYKMPVPKDIMPMTIGTLGNSSVATIPTLYDQLIKGELDNHEIEKGDILLFASVGAGMNISAFLYKV
ncbi:MAG: ketoacyl-ACP synthase III [Saprospiraceae bacterium]|nr:ketoacyl-ACP synthase III [Candidatus Brachybacter algidus]